MHKLWSFAGHVLAVAIDSCWCVLLAAQEGLLGVGVAAGVAGLAGLALAAIFASRR